MFFTGFGDPRGRSPDCGRWKNRNLVVSIREFTNFVRCSKINPHRPFSLGIRSCLAQKSCPKISWKAGSGHDQMAQSHFSFRRLRLFVSRRSPRGSCPGHKTCSPQKISPIYGRGVHCPRILSSFNLQLCRCASGNRTTFVQTGKFKINLNSCWNVLGFRVNKN